MKCAGVMGASDVSDDQPAVMIRDLWMSFPGKRSGEPTHVLEKVDVDVRH